MAPEPVDLAQHEQLLDELIVSYLEAEEAGQAPDRADLLRRYPSLAAALTRFFRDHDQVGQLGAPLRRIARLVQEATHSAGDTPCAAGTEGGAPGQPAAVRSFGDYELLEVIARGGMGVVYRARQKSLQRIVALKMIRQSDLASPAEQQRFRNEAEAAAELDHPHIVPIYEVGEEAGRLYFSMRYMEGGSLAQLLAPAAGGGRLPPREAARLLVPVARAVYHAHERGILHRDLKPSNILLDAEGRPHVADFGLAKRLTAEQTLTETGAILGTPGYMAPEQTAGKRGLVTTAADVYGLGAVLYALLTGRPPFQGESVLETLEQVRTQAPDPPSSHDRRVDRDLETICLRCLEKGAARRYPSAEELADDLERWLAGEPIRARPVGRLARLGRWCRRNPVVAGLVGLVVLGSALSGSWIVWQTTRTRAEYVRAQQNLDMAYQVLDELYLDQAGQRMQGQKDLSPEDRQFLARVLGFYQQFAEGNSREPTTRLKMAKAYRRVADIQFALKDYPSAEKANAESMRILSRLAEEFPSVPDYWSALVSGRINWGHALLLNGRLGEAERAYRETVEVSEERLKVAPTDVGARRAAASGHLNRANPLALMGRSREAVEESRTAIRLYRELAAAFPEEWRYPNALLITFSNLGGILIDCDQLDEAEAAYGEMQRLVEQFPEFRGDPVKMSEVSIGLASIARRKGRPREADEHCAEALPITEAMFAADPNGPNKAPLMAELCLEQGLLLQARGRLDEAEAVVRRASDPAERMLRKSPGVPDYASLLARVHLHGGDLLRALGRDSDAETSYRQAGELLQKLAADFPERATDRSNLGWALDGQAQLAVDRGSSEAALPLLDQALRHHQAALALYPRHGLYRQHLGDHWRVRSFACLRGGDGRGALDALKNVPQFREYDGADLFLLALGHGRLGENDQAREQFRQAVAWTDKHQPQDEALRRLRAEAAVLLGVADSPARPDKEVSPEK